MKNFREALREEMTNPDFKDEWDALEPEFNRTRETLREQNISTTDVTLDPSASLKYFKCCRRVRAVK